MVGTYGTADVTSRTGISGALLRTWEDRYGFPVPSRSASGRRRYTEDDVRAVLEVKRRRDAGVRLAAAIADVRRSEAGEGAGPTGVGGSLFAHARRHWPGATVHRVEMEMLLALTHAIEDEAHASARSPLLFGLFQDEHGLSGGRARWEELARAAGAALVFADFGESDAPPLPDGAVGVPLQRSSPLVAEWAVVVDEVEVPVALVARESLHEPGGRSEDRRWFDAMWTVEPVEVRAVARRCLELALAAGVEVPPPAREALAQPARSSGETGTAAATLTGRALAHASRGSSPAVQPGHT